ncbi:MAG: DUF6326 family protein [Phototrophicaceae bacterium]
MTRSNSTNGMQQDRRVIFSTLWLVVMLNIIFADILSFLNPEFLQELLTTGAAAGVEITPSLLVLVGIITQIPIWMIFLSRVLRHNINRWANIIASLITMAYVLGGGSLMPHYILIASIEVACMLFIIWYAWTWKAD